MPNETIDIAVEDNTDNSLNTEIKEPDQNSNDNEQENNEQQKTKFNNLEEAIAAHSALQKKLGENSRELGELRKQKAEYEKFKENQLKFVQNYGFNTVEEFEEHQLEEQYNKDLASFEADEYLKYIDDVQDPEEMKKVLLKYRQNPDKEILDFIEAEFPMDVIKKVAGKLELAKGQLQAKKTEAQKEQFMRSAQEYLDINVNKYSDDFKNPAFAALYAEAFGALGTDLNTDLFVTLLKKYADSVIKNADIQKEMINEDENAKDEIAGLSIGQTQSYTEKPLQNMSEKELNKYISKFI